MEEKQLSVKERLIAIETFAKTMWTAHDQRSKERWDSLETTLKEIKTFMKGEAERKTGCMEEARKYTNRAVAWALGIPVTVCSFITLFVMIHKILFK